MSIPDTTGHQMTIHFSILAIIYTFH